jgi:hypothetical protein
MTVLLGSGSGTFATSEVVVSPEWVPGGGGAPIALETADFNNDGNVDIATAIAWSNLVYVVLGNGDGTFPALVAPAAYVFDDAIFLLARDFNADGLVDLAVSHLDPYMAVVPGLGDGTFGHWDYFWAEPWSYPWPLPSASIAAADVNEDGHVDLIRTDNARDEADYVRDGVSIHLADGAGAFLPRTRIGTARNPRYLTAADFNGDGHADIAAANYAAGTAGILFGAGDASFPVAMEVATGAGPSGLASADFNGDGGPDLAVANAVDGTVSILINTSGCGADTAPPLITGAYATPSVLWPPNGRMRPVVVAVEARDECSAAACRIVAVESSEAAGNGTAADDWILTGDLTLLLRSERDGRGEGRAYTITVQCSDESGNTSEQAVNVTVPHDARARRDTAR